MISLPLIYFAVCKCIRFISLGWFCEGIKKLEFITSELYSGMSIHPHKQKNKSQKSKVIRMKLWHAMHSCLLRLCAKVLFCMEYIYPQYISFRTGTTSSRKWRNSAHTSLTYNRMVFRATFKKNSTCDNLKLNWSLPWRAFKLVF